MTSRRWALLFWSLTGLCLAVLLLKTFVADVYRVDSGSMRPTLFGGRDRADGVEDAEHVLVLYGQDELERFDLAVFRSRDGTKPLVKRVCGIPGDQDLMIRGGDLFIRRKRLPADAPRPAPIPVYDDRLLDPEAFFEYRRDGSVRREGDAWVVEGGTLPPGSLLHYHPALRDDYFDRQGRRVPGIVEVNDAVLALEFRLDALLAEPRVRLRLVEEGDTFELLLAIGPDGAGEARLLRRNEGTLHPRRDPSSKAPFTGEIELARASVELVPGRWIDVRFANIDNHLHAQSAALGLDLRASYAENEPWPAPLPLGQRSLGPRVHFGAEQATARFRAVRILRDLYYTDPEGPEQAPISLGPDDYFLLGDNSSASTDSRHFGALKASQMIGRPWAVVWPEPHWLRPILPP